MDFLVFQMELNNGIFVMERLFEWLAKENPTNLDTIIIAIVPAGGISLLITFLPRILHENHRKTEECWKIIKSGLEDILSSRSSPKG